MTSVPSSYTRIFHYILSNSLVAAVTNAFVRFALTYRVFLETQSIIATSFIAGIFAVCNAASSFVFGSIVDHNKKKAVMLGSTVLSLVLYSIAAIMYFSTPEAVFSNPSSVWLWILIVVLMLGSIAGGLRIIALSTLVSLLIPLEQHANANGKIGIMNGLSFTITSVASGLVIGFLGMGRALIVAVGLSVLVTLHLLTITIPEKDIIHTEGPQSKFAVKQTIALIGTVPGLFALIFFTTFNNFLGGVFMALMDAYGLSLMSVQTWGILRGVLSIGFIAGGMLIAKFGLGKNPVKTMFLINCITRSVCVFFTIQASIVLLAAGMLIWLICSPFIEAAENTIVQKVVPYEKQGRVFGFAHSVESAASPITTFLIGPLTQLVFIPFMTTGAGVELIGSRFGTGMNRGIALVFTIAGIIGLCVTLIAKSSKYYTMLSDQYASSSVEPSSSPETV